MFDVLAAATKKIARDFDPSLLSASEAADAMEELTSIRRVVDGLIGQVAKRVQETDAHLRRGDRSASAFAARALGTTTSEVNAAIKTASQLEELPASAAAVRRGQLSAPGRAADRGGCFGESGQ